MINLAPLFLSFGTIAVAEVGDKTQLAAIALSASYRPVSVFVGAMLAMALIDGLSVLAGVAVGEVVPMQLVGLIGAAIFIGFGVYTLLKRNAGRVYVKRGKRAVVVSFSLVSVMELGDKTQFALIALAARYGSPLLVFLGAMLAYIVLMGVGVTIGGKLLRRVPPRYLRIFTGALFLLFGVLFLLSVAGIKLG